ncbi:putative transcription factor Nin-like family [Helianthus annuus]|nr:putative transcription factor Nin-like family [Helianthus annuus]KAJ0446109.1 putative transcription factor Nin-like family [Helianthus annuus]
MPDMPRGEIYAEPQRFMFSGESRYLNSLWVSGNEDRSSSTTIGLELGAANIDPNNQKIQDKIEAALKVVTFREQHVLVQFWGPHEFGKHQILTTIGQPFGVGVPDAGLSLYRRDSEGRSFVVDKDHEEEDCSPPARVFRRGLPEWTPDVTNYMPKHFLQQECAIRCNLHGYLALPVFDSNTLLCVGVLELLTSSKYTSYAYEVQQLHNALETVDLRTTQAFGCPALNVLNERRKNDSDKIYGILKTACDIHGLPLAQTWAVSEHSSSVSHENVIKRSCSSFDTRCVGKVCMSRAALPFYVQDLGVWPFSKACRERHLDGSRGYVGKALLSHGSCFCGDVTKLSEEEYPLVHNALMNGLTSCFAIFLHSVEANDDYVLEFFLPPDIKDCGDVKNLVQTLKQKIETASGFELGDSSLIQVVGPPTNIGRSLSIDAHTIQISSITTTKNNKFETVTSDSESVMENIANKTESSANVPNQCPPKQIHPDKFSDIITGTENNINVVGARKNNDMISYPSVSMQKTSDNITDAGEKNNRLKQGRKRKIDSLTMEAVEKHVEKPIDEAAKSLGVSRSTLKRFCREHDMPSWPLPNHRKKTVHTTDLKPSPKAWTKQNLQWQSNKRFRFAFVVFLMVRVKRWSCLIKSHGVSGKWWSCGRHSYLPSKSDFIYQAARLFVLLRRWKNKNSMRNTLRSGDHLAGIESTTKPKYTTNIINPYSCVAESTLVHASPKQTVTNISNIKMVTVKATFNADMIKFQFPTSSGLLELEHEVARRIKLKSRRPRLKYRDEDNDLILLACDADLHHLLGFAANHSPIRLVIVADD